MLAMFPPLPPTDAIDITKAADAAVAAVAADATDAADAGLAAHATDCRCKQCFLFASHTQKVMSFLAAIMATSPNRLQTLCRGGMTGKLLAGLAACKHRKALASTEQCFASVPNLGAKPLLA